MIQNYTYHLHVLMTSLQKKTQVFFKCDLFLLFIRSNFNALQKYLMLWNSEIWLQIRWKLVHKIFSTQILYKKNKKKLIKCENIYALHVKNTINNICMCLFAKYRLLSVLVRFWRFLSVIRETLPFCTFKVFELNKCSRKENNVTNILCE
jgi:TRAP-type mannitol/chloroaromatic compound transport system permease small subunit